MPPPMIVRCPSLRWFCWPAFAPPSEPKLHVLLTRRFTVVDPGPSPKLRGIIAAPGAYVSRKLPNGVHLTIALEQSAPAGANAGRSLLIVSLFRSRPRKMLNGRPDCTM